MATPADQRLLELLGRWLESLDLHAKYSSLDDDSYWNIQPWAEHQRPARWIVDLAKQKTLALRTQVEERIKAGDAQFSDSLELMIFLANLVGSEHIERYIPVAEARNERTPAPPGAEASAREAAPALSSAAPSPASAATSKAASEAPSEAAPGTATGTREMPKFLATKRTTPQPASTAQVARNERKPAATTKPAPKAPAKQAAKKTATPERSGPAEAAREQVIADAARLVQWGRKWFELPELIARMADRPPLPEVRRILKENKATIDKKAGVA